MNRKDSTSGTRTVSAAEVILGALAAAACANLAIVLATGGYDIWLLGVHMRATTPGRPLTFLLALLLVRWLVSLPRVGLKASVKSIAPWGLAAVCAGSVAYLAMLGMRAPLVPAWVTAVVWALSAAGLAVAWFAWAGHPRASQLVLAVLGVALMAGLAGSLSTRGNWERMFGLMSPRFVAGLTVSADRFGLLSGDGSNVAFEKRALSGDWRDAAAISAGGFLTAEAVAGEGAKLAFAVGRSGDLSGSVAQVAMGSGGSSKVLWKEDAASLPADAWRQVTVALPAGDVRLEFALEGGKPAGNALFANPSIVPAGGQAPKRPNVILVVVDALRRDRMSLYGYGKPTSPEIDKLAGGAVVFDGCLSQAPWTMPSMTSVFTSLFPTVHGTNGTDMGLVPELPVLAESMRRAGYVTAGFQPNALLPPQAGFARGFALYRHYPTRRPTVLDPGRYESADAVNRDALAWLDAREKGPFFLYLHYMDVHDPYVPPQDFRRFGDNESALYDAAISYVSNRFAALYGELEKRGLMADTMIVLMSDHGEQFLEHGWTRHGNCLFSEEVQVPLVVWHPGQQTGRRVSGLCRGVDVAPTILDAAGAEALPDAEGASLMPVVRGGALEPRTVLSEFFTIYPPGQHVVSMTEDGYRLISYNPGTSTALRLELYNLAADPAERVNLAAAEHERCAAMAGRIETFVAEQSALHARLVPKEFVLPLTDEKKRELEALGYLNK